MDSAHDALWAGEAAGRSMEVSSRVTRSGHRRPKIRSRCILHDTPHSSIVFAPVASVRLLWVEPGGGQVELC